MKKFLEKIGLLLLILVGVILIITSVNRLIFKCFNPFVLNDNVNVVVLGDSQARLAFNDRILNHIKNFSNNADSYFYSYLKLRELVACNSHIDTLLISFAEHNVNESIDNQWLLNNNHLESHLKYYFPLLQIEDFSFLIKRKPIEFLKGMFLQIYFPFNIEKGGKKYGGFEVLYDNRLSILLDKYNNGEIFKDTGFAESVIEIKYLKKIVDLCNKNKVTVVFVNTPVYSVLQNSQVNLSKVYNKYFKNISYLDYTSVEMNDSCYIDLVHLNYYGSLSFSEKIKREGLFFNIGN